MHWTHVSKEVAICPHHRASMLCEQLRVEWAQGQRTPTPVLTPDFTVDTWPGSQPAMGQQKRSIYQLEYLQQMKGGHLLHIC